MRRIFWSGPFNARKRAGTPGSIQHNELVGLMIPSFNDSGNLPPGIHDADWGEIETRFGHSPRRAELLEGLREGLALLRSAGCQTAYLDGSFATAKEAPGDFDACWESKGVVLNELAPSCSISPRIVVRRRNASAGSSFRPMWQLSREDCRFLSSSNVSAIRKSGRGSSRLIWRI